MNSKMKYEYYNPVDEKGSCIARTMTKLFDKEYETVKEELMNIAKELGYDDYRETEVFEKKLTSKSFDELKTMIDKEIVDRIEDRIP